MEPLEQLYRDRYVGFRNALAPITGSQESARDVVQEAFAIALRDRRQLRRRESLAPWVWQIAYRLALRERGRSVTDELPEDIGCSIRNATRRSRRRSGRCHRDAGWSSSFATSATSRT